ncbi:uncharacterized protein LOC143861972 isoform X2 [Tasmannia lanceolata]
MSLPMLSFVLLLCFSSGFTMFDDLDISLPQSPLASPLYDSPFGSPSFKTSFDRVKELQFRYKRENVWVKHYEHMRGDQEKLISELNGEILRIAKGMKKDVKKWVFNGAPALTAAVATVYLMKVRPFQTYQQNRNDWHLQHVYHTCVFS